LDLALLRIPETPRTAMKKKTGGGTKGGGGEPKVKAHCPRRGGFPGKLGRPVQGKQCGIGKERSRETGLERSMPKAILAGFEAIRGEREVEAIGQRRFRGSRNQTHPRREGEGRTAKTSIGRWT